MEVHLLRLLLRDRCREIDILEFKITLYNGNGARGYELPALNTLGEMVFDSWLTGGLYDAISKGERDGFEVGERIILPMSFTRGPRYMYAHYLDALAIFQKLGNPQFFITFTCNVKWLEIRRYMADYPELTATDRRDIVCRVFEQKFHTFLDLKSKKIFETVTAASKIQEPKDIDQVILAEIPDPHIDPRGYKVVSEMMMIHGPYGAVNMSASCMQSDKPLGESSNAAGPSRPLIDKIQNYLEGRFELTRLTVVAILLDCSFFPPLAIYTYLIIWDEALINDRRCFEALDRTLNDVLTMHHRLFGGKSILLGRDFRKTIPVKKGASKMKIIASCISQSN
nr:DNA helicase [Tanacetum cinerariifolium]